LRREQTPDPEFAIDSTSSITVDWRELQRWNISESRLPPGVVVLFKEKSILDRYRWYILGVVTLCLCEAILILALLLQGARRKRAEEALRESEERLRLAAQAGRMYAFEWNMASDVIVRTGQCRDILNWMDDPTRDTGRQFITIVHPDDREAYSATETGRTPDNPTYQTNYRMLRPDGNVIWLEESGHAFFDGKGGMLRIIGMVANVTERKVAEAALARVSRKLIEAQEQERVRIARELHDDIGQRLALLTIELEQLRQNSPDLRAEVHSRIDKLHNQTAEIASDVQSMSHDLHSSKLEYLGIVTAMTGFCKKLSEQQKVEIEFAHDDIPSKVPEEISLCLFRVLQEALQNAVKHSGVRHFDVKLRYASDMINLTVRDSGRGFDVEGAMHATGLGLVSMAERLKLVDGQFSIASKAKGGTTIHARVPLSKVARAGM
jgi:signal transduction histidine kinase